MQFLIHNKSIYVYKLVIKFNISLKICTIMSMLNNLAFEAGGSIFYQYLLDNKKVGC